MKNSPLRIVGVEGEWDKRDLTTLNLTFFSSTIMEIGVLAFVLLWKYQSCSNATTTPVRGKHGYTMPNSLVRIVDVEGEWDKRNLTTLIWPFSHQQLRRFVYQHRSRHVSIKAEDLWFLSTCVKFLIRSC